MPPTHRLYIKKRWKGFEWGNTYAVNAADAAAAYAIGQDIMALEQTYTWEEVDFYGVRVSTWAADGRTGRTYPGGGAGDVAFTYPLPIECALRIQFFPGVKQASVKYYHFMLQGQDQVAGEIVDATYNGLQALGTALIAVAGFVDNAGGDLSGFQIDRQVSMHQMDRAWAARPGVEEGD